ncbi:hypothetical protein ACSMFR_05895 [Listeria aquatica]|uniref:hypothetical protein n=1 Tax=Listeria aquatica TaxID=1494960 RepID=UPI003F72094D
MTDKKRLYYLLNGLQNRTVDINSFVDQFVKIFDLDIDYNELTENEYKIMGEVSERAARFSDSLEDLELPNVYYNEEQIRSAVGQAIHKLS